MKYFNNNENKMNGKLKSFIVIRFVSFPFQTGDWRGENVLCLTEVFLLLYCLKNVTRMQMNSLYELTTKASNQKQNK